MSDDEIDMLPDLNSVMATTPHRPNELLRQAVTHGRPPPVPSSNGIVSGKRREMSELPWSDFFDDKREVNIDGDVFNVYLKGDEGPIFYLLHGGGYSGLTWACFAKELCTLVTCRVIAPDLRGHGDTRCADEHDLSKETQIKDISAIFNKVYGDTDESVCIVGHSMGGALAVHTLNAKAISAKVAALIVIDVVEGSAMEALGGMVHFLHSRPSSFDSVEKAIRWCLSSGTAKNPMAARVSMPSQIREVSESEYTWRIDLTTTEQYWKGWFEGLSREFLGCAVPKLLVLAGVDRLDKDLTIGQMQGKFQTCVLPKVGHCVQEDSPEKLADEIGRFACRHRIAQPNLKFSPLASPPDPAILQYERRHHH
ncbi:hypothetical protein CRE_25587 [Caenorhabditis remanei]|uniref:Protein phosphatase methylesterase 1 n=1 Tax=Caenorhabditis remanei TaxID=31234 RepID=E3LSF8_CAERE|nr:hypothetical protein CRE_25587 [Caenorhabditis remanei]